MADWRDLALGLGIAIILEGAVWALFPGAMRRLMTKVVAQTPEATLRWVGFAALLVGLMVARLGLGHFG